MKIPDAEGTAQAKDALKTGDAASNVVDGVPPVAESAGAVMRGAAV